MKSLLSDHHLLNFIGRPKLQIYVIEFALLFVVNHFLWSRFCLGHEFGEIVHQLFVEFNGALTYRDILAPLPSASFAAALLA